MPQKEGMDLSGLGIDSIAVPGPATRSIRWDIAISYAPAASSVVARFDGGLSGAYPDSPVDGKNYVVEEDSYELGIEFVDSIGLRDVLIYSTDLSGNKRAWGELTTVAMSRGAVGCSCDSNPRDCAMII